MRNRCACFLHSAFGHGYAGRLGVVESFSCGGGDSEENLLRKDWKRERGPDGDGGGGSERDDVVRERFVDVGEGGLSSSKVQARHIECPQPKVTGMLKAS